MEPNNSSNRSRRGVSIVSIAGMCAQKPLNGVFSSGLHRIPVSLLFNYKKRIQSSCLDVTMSAVISSGFRHSSYQLIIFIGGNPTHVDDGQPMANQTSLQAQPRADLDPGLTVQPGRDGVQGYV